LKAPALSIRALTIVAYWRPDAESDITPEEAWALADIERKSPCDQ
jgi:hypothetical protein